MVSHSKRGANIGYFFENKAKKGGKMKKKQEVGCASVFFLRSYRASFPDFSL